MACGKQEVRAGLADAVSIGSNFQTSLCLPSYHILSGKQIVLLVAISGLDG